jgi:hypothetical protein
MCYKVLWAIRGSQGTPCLARGKAPNLSPPTSPCAAFVYPAIILPFCFILTSWNLCPTKAATIC